MSWNKFIYDHMYHREDKFDYIEWLRQGHEDEYHWGNWLWSLEMMSYDEFGAPKSLTELAQYRLLTLLHRIRIKSAIKVIDQIGWH